MNNKIALIIAGIALLAVGFAGGYWYGQKLLNDSQDQTPIIENQVNDEVTALFDQLKADTGIDFSEITETTFDWNLDSKGSVAQVSGKQISTTVSEVKAGDSEVLNASNMKIKDYLTSNGFALDIDNVAAGTTVGLQGYIKGNLVCTLSGGWDGTPVESTAATYNLTCGLLNQ